MNVKTLERSFNEKIDREMGSIFDTVGDRIQNANLTAIDSIITPEIKLAVRSISASSGRDGECIGFTAFFKNVSERNNTLQVLNTKHGTGKDIPDEVSELSVPRTHFDRQPHIQPINL